MANSVAPPSTQHVGKIGFLFGMLDASELPGPVLVRLLGYLGLKPSAATTLLQRMRRALMLDARHLGRVAIYRMTGLYAQRYQQLAAGLSKPPAWDGWMYLLIYDVPEVRRRARSELLKVASGLGYAPLRSGVWLSCWDRRTQLLSVAQQILPTDLITVGQFKYERDDAAALIARAFDLSTRAARIRELAGEIGQQSQATTDGDAAALARCWEVSKTAIGELIAHTNLPAELLPPDWPGGKLAAALGEYHQRQGPALRRFLEHDIASHPNAELVVRGTITTDDPDISHTRLRVAT